MWQFGVSVLAVGLPADHHRATVLPLPGSARRTAWKMAAAVAPSRRQAVVRLRPRGAIAHHAPPPALADLGARSPVRIAILAWQGQAMPVDVWSPTAAHLLQAMTVCSSSSPSLGRIAATTVDGIIA